LPAVRQILQPVEDAPPQKRLRSLLLVAVDVHLGLDDRNQIGMSAGF
jgi:hypothetical protein